jgi:exodeoxyribonuclease-5
MTWSPQQDDALCAVDGWLHERDRQVFRLFGYAGTGKTTLAAAVGSQISGVYYCAFTGKAAQVLRSYGAEPATTIHRLIYKTTFDPETGRYQHTLRPRAELADIKLIIVDECSMVGARLGQQLVSYGTPILAVGDPEQLPPVQDKGAFFMDLPGEPDVVLTEIHRQALQSPILALATDIRNGGKLWRSGRYNSGALHIVRNTPEVPEAFDMLLVGRNAARRAWNGTLRRKLGFCERGQRPSPPPQRSERVVCLRNDYGFAVPLLNGGVWQVNAAVPKIAFVTERGVPVVELALEGEDGAVDEVRVPLAWFGAEVGEGQRQRWHSLGLQEFDFANALTVHKAQGSQWENVLLFAHDVEPFVHHQGKEFGRRWLYTAITRASEKLTVVI